MNKEYKEVYGLLNEIGNHKTDYISFLSRTKNELTKILNGLPTGDSISHKLINYLASLDLLETSVDYTKCSDKPKIKSPSELESDLRGSLQKKLEEFQDAN